MTCFLMDILYDEAGGVVDDDLETCVELVVFSTLL
jgi:hypothetical protein